MAKPTVGEENSERLHMRISPEEIASIDDWRFANRVATRSDAVRRLLQIGVRADARALGLLEASRASLEAGKALWQGVLDQLENGQNDGDSVTVSADKLREALRLMFETQEAAGGLVRDVIAFHQSAGAIEELEKAIAARREYKQLVYERGDREHEE